MIIGPASASGYAVLPSKVFTTESFSVGRGSRGVGGLCAPPTQDSLGSSWSLEGRAVLFGENPSHQWNRKKSE